MALVRILSDDAQYCEKLTKDLRARGFEVESPEGLENGSGSDPQISIVECTPEEFPQVASTIQQEIATTGSISTNEIAFLIPQILSGNARSLKAIVVRSKPHPKTMMAVEAISPVTQSSQKTGDGNITQGALGPESAPKAAGKTTSSDDFLVPHGLVWQAVSGAGPSPWQESLASAAPSGTSSEPSAVKSHPAAMAHRDSARSRSIAFFSNKNHGDRRFWNVAAIAAGTAVLALLIVSHVHRISPLSTPVEAHTSQPSESVPFDAAKSNVADQLKDIPAKPSAHVLTAQGMGKSAHAANKTNNLLGKDTVVHFSGARAIEANAHESNKQTQHTAGVRYFSDLD